MRMMSNLITLPTYRPPPSGCLSWGAIPAVSAAGRGCHTEEMLGSVLVAIRAAPSVPWFLQGVCAALELLSSCRSPSA